MMFKTAARVVEAQGVVGLFEYLGWEVFLERPQPWQRGYWVQTDWPTQCLRIGIGGAMVCVARLPR